MKGEVLLNGSPADCPSCGTDRSIFSAKKMQECKPFNPQAARQTKMTAVSELKAVHRRVKINLKKKIYLKIDKLSLRYDYFMFFDTPEYLADRLFIEQKVRVWFDREYTKAGSPYLAILCHVKKKDTAKFLAALDALKNKMILCGYPEYEIEAQKMICHLEKAGNANTRRKNTRSKAE